MKNRFNSLLHYIPEEQLENLTPSSLAAFIHEWQKSIVIKGSSIEESFGNIDTLNQAIADLRNHFPIQKKIFADKTLLLFLEGGEVNEKTISSILNLGISNSESWQAKLIHQRIIEEYQYSFWEEGLKSQRKVDALNSLCAQLPNAMIGEIRSGLEQKLTASIHQLFIDPSNHKSSSHYSLILNTIQPIDNTIMEKLYGQKLSKYVNNHLKLAYNGKVDHDRMLDLVRGAKKSGEILGDANLLKISAELQNWNNLKGKKIAIKPAIPYVVWIILSIILGCFAIFYLINFFKNESNNYESRYKEYVEERKEYSANRKISKETIEQRQLVEITSNEYYGEKDGFPLFETMIKTNKFLDINEIDQEIYKLRNKVAKDSFDVNTIYIRTLFYRNLPEKPYRNVLSKFENIRTTKNFKQMTIPRSTKSFTVNNPVKNFRLNLQEINNYSSGVIDFFEFEVDFALVKDSVYTYQLIPEIELFSVETFKDVSAQKMSELSPGTIAWRIFSYLEEERMAYRRQKKLISSKIFPLLENPQGTIGWELTMEDNTAFIRIRSEEISGYFLVDRNSGVVQQARVSYRENAQLTKEFIVQLVPS